MVKNHVSAGDILRLLTLLLVKTYFYLILSWSHLLVIEFVRFKVISIVSKVYQKFTVKSVWESIKNVITSLIKSTTYLLSPKTNVRVKYDYRFPIEYSKIYKFSTTKLFNCSLQIYLYRKIYTIYFCLLSVKQIKLYVLVPFNLKK